MEHISRHVFNPVVQGLDVDEIVRKIDVNALVAKIDLDAVLERIDLNEQLHRVDVDALLRRVNVNELIQRSNLNSIIIQSTSGIWTHTIDTFRALMMRADVLFHGLCRCSCQPIPSSREIALSKQGMNAGLLSRFVAWMIDEAIIFGSFSLSLIVCEAAWGFVVRFLSHQKGWLTTVSSLAENDVDDEAQQWSVVWTAALLFWWGIVYNFVGLALVGRTIGKAIMGLRVLSVSRRPMTALQALLRSLATSLVLMVLAASCIGCVRKDFRQLHDLVVCTRVVYSWDTKNWKLREQYWDDFEAVAYEVVDEDEEMGYETIPSHHRRRY